MRLVGVKPPQIAFGLLAAGVGLHFLLLKTYRLDFSCLVCAIIAASVGFGIMMGAWWLFRRAGTPIRPTDHATSLITGGPYRFSRNPMYLGIALMLLGIALFAGSWPMLIPPLGIPRSVLTVREGRPRIS